MASDALLLVLIVREAGLRSALVARLSMAGVDVITTDDFADPRLDRHRRRPLVLIADEGAIEERSDGVDALLGDLRWRRLVVLGEKVAEDAEINARVVHLARANAAAMILDLLPDWAMVTP